MAKPDNAADEDANDSSTTEQDQLYGFFDDQLYGFFCDGLTITSHHKGQDTYDFLTNKKETLSSKVAGTDTKQTTAEGRADHNPSDEKDDPENPLAGWNLTTYNTLSQQSVSALPITMPPTSTQY
jgi:restriction endonuclease S subunit